MNECQQHFGKLVCIYCKGVMRTRGGHIRHIYGSWVVAIETAPLRGRSFAHIINKWPKGLFRSFAHKCKYVYDHCVHRQTFWMFKYGCIWVYLIAFANSKQKVLVPDKRKVNTIRRRPYLIFLYNFLQTIRKFLWNSPQPNPLHTLHNRPKPYAYTATPHLRYSKTKRILLLVFARNSVYKRSATI